MIKRLISLACTALVVVSLPIPAHATLTLHGSSTAMSLSLGGDGKTLIKTGGPVVFTNGSQQIASTQKIFACSQPQSAVTSATSGYLPAVGGAQCRTLYNADGTLFAGTDLALARIESASGGSPVYTTPYDISYGAHIVWQSFAVDSGYYWSVYPASVQATQPTPPPLTTSQANATLSKSGSSFTTGLSVAGKMQVPSNPSSGVYVVTGIVFGGTQAQLSASVGTTDVLTAAGANPISVTVLRAGPNAVSPQTHINAQLSSLTTPYISVCWVIDYETRGTHYVCSASVSTGNASSVSGESSPPAPKYSGPEFSSFGAPVLAGNKLVSEGKRLDGITSLKVNGQAVTYKINSASQLEIDVPSNLAPGQYDVEITSAHGKLTHLKAFTVKAVVPTKDQAFKVDGGWFNYGDLLALTNTAKTIGDEYTSVKCIVNGADAAIAERLAKRACDYIGATRLRGKAITHEAKSTFTGSGYWVRVIANG